MGKKMIKWIIAIVLCVVCGPAFSRLIAVGELFFPHNSTAFIPENWKLDNLVCRAEQSEFDAIIIVGYADKTEKNAQQLSEQRAEQIKKTFISRGFPEKKLYTEGKGGRQPVLNNDIRKNRRVEIEVVGGMSIGPFTKPCDASLGKLFISLSPSNALVLARSVVHEGISAYVPAAEAITLKRMDLFESFLDDSTIKSSMTADDRVALMRTAIVSGDIQFVERLISFGIRVGEFTNPGLPVVWAACYMYTPDIRESEQARVMEALIAWGADANGAHSDSGARYEYRPLVCAARTNRLVLVDILLANGANPNLPVSDPPLIAGARYRDMVQKLINAGANPRTESGSGYTLFHNFRFEKPQDVEWIAGFGLDINARTAPKGGATPLQLAAEYASPEVLEAFVGHGASIDQEGLIKNTTGNIPGLLWLLNHGAPLDKDYATFIFFRGDKAVPVIEALHHRGANLREPNARGGTSLQSAITVLSPKLVERLLEFGVINGVQEAAFARAFAERQSVRRWPSMCIDCFPTKEDMEQREAELNAAEILADRQQRKDRIVEILKAEEERLRKLQ